jgi:peptide/nickel transport system permease protein
MAELVRRMLRSPQGRFGLLIVGAMLIVAIVGPLIAPYNPETFAPLQRYKPPSLQYWLGTDQYGRDILSRLLAGAQRTVLLAILASALGTLAGALIMASTYAVANFVADLAYAWLDKRIQYG